MCEIRVLHIDSSQCMHCMDIPSIVNDITDSFSLFTKAKVTVYTASLPNGIVHRDECEKLIMGEN